MDLRRDVVLQVVSERYEQREYEHLIYASREQFLKDVLDGGLVEFVERVEHIIISHVRQAFGVQGYYVLVVVELRSMSYDQYSGPLTFLGLINLLAEDLSKQRVLSERFAEVHHHLMSIDGHDHVLAIILESELWRDVPCHVQS